MKTLTAALLLLSAAISLPAQAQTELDRIRQQVQQLQSPGSAQSFRFEGFELADSGAAGMARWNVRLTSGQAIAGNVYAVRSAWLSASGAVLLTGDDIALPASRAGRAIALTREARLQPGMAALRLEVVDRARGEVVHAQSFSVSAQARATLEPRHADQPAAAPAVPARALPEGGAPSVALRLLPDGKSFEVRNSGVMSVRLENVAVHYRFPGLDGEARSSCSRAQLPPGQAATCTLDETRMACSSLAGLDVAMALNGQPVQQRVPFEPLIRAIGHSPRIELEKPPSAGMAKIRVRATGQYVRPGTRAVAKGLITLNNLQRFPATFRLTQDADELQATEFVASPVENKPVDRVCFHLQEIVTEDTLSCGGVGLLLYRNEDRGQIPLDPATGNVFVINQLCR